MINDKFYFVTRKYLVTDRKALIEAAFAATASKPANDDDDGLWASTVQADEEELRAAIARDDENDDSDVDAVTVALRILADDAPDKAPSGCKEVAYDIGPLGEEDAAHLQRGEDIKATVLGR